MIVACVLLAPQDVASAPPVPPSVPPALLSSGVPLSVGAPNAGRLIRGVKLEPSDRIRIVPAWNGPDFRWGLPELISMVQRAANTVHIQHGSCKISVGDLSSKNGGTLRKHRSHQSGRDVDIAFYMTDRRGKPLYHHVFVEFDAAGRAKNHPEARFDDARNWTLVEAMLLDPQARVQHIFVSNELRKRLLMEAERRGTPSQIRLRAARVMTQPEGSSAHADHFHVRIGCPGNQHGACEPWPRTTTPSVSVPEEKASPRAKGKRRRAGTEG